MCNDAKNSLPILALPASLSAVANNAFDCNSVFASGQRVAAKAESVVSTATAFWAVRPAANVSSELIKQ